MKESLKASYFWRSWKAAAQPVPAWKVEVHLPCRRREETTIMFLFYLERLTLEIPYQALLININTQMGHFDSPDIFSNFLYLPND